VHLQIIVINYYYYYYYYYHYHYHYYYHYHCLTAFFQDNLGKPAPERQNHSYFNEARDNGVAVASAEPHANHLYLTPDR